jgi:hypothetical protein
MTGARLVGAELVIKSTSSQFGPELAIKALVRRDEDVTLDRREAAELRDYLTDWLEEVGEP